MSELLTPAPLVVAEERASCGCAFVKVRERIFDLREGEWFERDGIVVVPCREEHLEIARTLKKAPVATMAERMSKKVK